MSVCEGSGSDFGFLESPNAMGPNNHPVRGPRPSWVSHFDGLMSWGLMLVVQMSVQALNASQDALDCHNRVFSQSLGPLRPFVLFGPQ